MKNLFSLCLLVLLFSCDKEETFTTNDNCLLTEDVVVSGNGGRAIKYFYDNRSRLIREEMTFENRLSSVVLYTYDEAGMLTALIQTGDGYPSDSTALIYNSEGQLVKSINYDIRERPIKEWYTYTYEYNSPNELRKLTINVLGYPDKYFLFEYRDGLMYKASRYEATGELFNTAVLEYDNRERSKTKVQDLRKLLYQDGVIGYPYQRNIRKQSIYTPHGVLQRGLSHESSYKYNADGYTTEMTIRDLSVTEFSTTVSKYNYQCM